ncbi:hypothetical protein [Lichenifustis flavocetrariae]|jgi:hypothetical protein|uniref:Uncharacterized protein n=1 Tax=Lichenifustis flavocetrariae TaxID=2949735 RepID=A0AA41Z3X5_9HYPH|nr:hypothetical protein [Lichenifustis flavocetrariae]MCW6512478.1 hypothetical protein [Lichenifustis flavocetrariae]
MADILTFPRNAVARSRRYLPAKIIGIKSGITVRILSRIGSPHDLLVVLDGTADGTTTVAAAPAGEMAVAEVIAHSVLAALDVAETTWKAQEVAWSR